jgi:hypothetical protein
VSLGPRALLTAMLALGCTSGGRGPIFETSASFDEVARRPPSFAPDLPASASPRDDAEVVGLSSAVMPLDVEAARDVVTRFFMAVLIESSRDLAPLLAGSAWAISEGNRQPAQAVWRARFAQLDYTMLSGRIVATPSTLRTYTYASAARAALDGVPPPQTIAEVVVVARPSLSWSGKARLFGDFVAFKLRPKRDQPAYEIAEIIEDFRLP